MMMAHGFLPMAGLATIGNVVLLSGIVLILAWAIKHLHGEKLRQAGLWCIVIGLMLSIVSLALGMTMKPYSKGKMLMWKGEMQEGSIMMDRQ